MARTMICDANNRPVFRKPRKDPKTGKTTPATRKAWLESQPMIVESSLTGHSVICKVCRDLVQLHPRYLYQVENWQKHIRLECSGRVREEGDSEPPAPKRRRLTRGSEPVMRTQMTLRSTRQTARRVEADRRLEQENIDDDETDVEDSPPDLYSSLAMLLPRTITFLILAAAGATAVLAAPVPVDEASNIDHAGIPQDFQESAQKFTSRLTGRKGRSTNIGGPGNQPKGDNYAATLPSPLAAVVLNKWTRIASSPIYSINEEHIDHLFKKFRRHRARKADMDMLNEYLYLAAYWPAVRGAVQEELRHISPRNSQWPVLNRLSTGKIEGGDLRIAFGFTAEELEKESEKILEKIQKAALSESPTSSTMNLDF
ncbi:hypothetical protein EV360DRAFT_85246 [Lentinula raphanica]|nr:hypothetical protein EV360DRAFT_85246 [Lentinula raphanica]